jgi:hypothetical protein
MTSALINSLIALGVPIHPLRYREKAPITDAWPKADTVFVWPDDCNTGLRAGMPIGKKTNDCYTFCLDIDKTEFNSAEKMQITRLIKKFFGRVDGSLSAKIIERSGGQHHGKHIIGCSHIPFSHEKTIHETLPASLYALNASYDAMNVAVTPSIVAGKYEIMDERNNGHVYSAADDVIIGAWEAVKASPISEFKWFNLVRDDFKWSREKIFIHAFLPFVCSDDFNRDFFGRVLSAIAATANFDTDILCKWTTALLNLLPHPDPMTVKSIIEFIRETPGRKRDDKWPGFPSLKASVMHQLPLQRGYDMSVAANKTAIAAAANFYSDLISWLFELPTTKPQQQISQKDREAYVNTMLLQDTKPSTEVKGLCFEDFMTPGGVGLMFGAEGTVKTWAMLDAAIAAATGEEFWGGRYTFREPMPVLYVYGDRNRANFQSKYINRYERKGPVKFFYVQDWTASCREAGLDSFEFDVGEERSQELLMDAIVAHKAKVVVIDTLASCLAIEVKNEKEVKKFMRAMRNIASKTGSFIWLIHHSNKMNAIELRGKILSKDDYQGSKMFSGLSDFTIVVSSSDKPLCGHVRIGKHGTISEFEDFDYKIINTPTPDGTDKTVRLELSESAGVVFGSKSTVNTDKLRMLKSIPADGWILGENLRGILHIGMTGSISPYHYKQFLADLRVENLINIEGATRNCKYFLTSAGRDYLATYGDSTCLI